jgi:hypothetical protein
VLPVLLIDGNNLGHALGYIDKAADRYDKAGLLSCLDSVARHLATQGQQVEIILFLDDVSAQEWLGGWHVQVAAVPGGDADAAIRAYAEAHKDCAQTLVSGDQALCNDAAMWGVVCLSPNAFISRYLIPARESGFFPPPREIEQRASLTLSEISRRGSQAAQIKPLYPPEDQGDLDRQSQAETLQRAKATLRGESPIPPEVFRLDLGNWPDATELAVYLAEHHLCPQHPELTIPGEMIAAIRDHCSRQERYFTSGHVIDRVFRLFLCRLENSLTLDDLARLAQTRRRKIRAAIKRQGEPLGIVVDW